MLLPPEQPQKAIIIIDAQALTASIKPPTPSDPKARLRRDTRKILRVLPFTEEGKYLSSPRSPTQDLPICSTSTAATHTASYKQKKHE